ncbi:hypothetical protein [Nostoc sp. MS1]|uniref:hypothetical protein n=1 Tax=Nostoc sp. MS1 TaxID=2764711 RepID=UPI001CC6B324|nr:hypothetical protein [Nostoc sp. MS1]BCL34491.1 hypothetical protein NSMS1_09380 [Nostoc sp. MS1]
MPSIQASQLIPLSITARSQLIKEYANFVNIPPNISSELHRAYQLSTVLTSLLPEFIQYQIQKDISHTHGSVFKLRRQSKSISSICRQFASNFIVSMTRNLRSPAQMEASPRNLYEMCGAGVFAESNSISRKLSTDMGTLWEKIANISPHAVDPEKDFGIKITGVDSIILPEGKGSLIFVQIKTQRNTLTGSQAPRSKSELELHPHRLFAAAFCTGDSWTFSSPSIPRVCGAEFWSMIGLDYELLKFHVKQMVLKIQSTYIAFQQQPPM